MLTFSTTPRRERSRAERARCSRSSVVPIWFSPTPAGRSARAIRRLSQMASRSGCRWPRSSSSHPAARPRHLMIVHVISEPKKTVFLDWLGVQSAIDRFITYSRWQQRFIEERWKLGRDRVLWTPFMVDQEFFAPERVTPNSSARPQICAVGLERRDYETLLRAVEDLDVHVVIAAASPWSKRTEGVATRTIPSNVTVRKFTQYELRQLYADSCFMVMPLENVKFQAGVTAILECLAMGKAVICSRVPGQTDVVVEGENGRYVPPGDPSDPEHGDPPVAVEPRRGTQIGRQRPQAGRTPDESRSLCRAIDRLSDTRRSSAEREDRASTVTNLGPGRIHAACR